MGYGHSKGQIRKCLCSIWSAPLTLNNFQEDVGKRHSSNRMSFILFFSGLILGLLVDIIQVQGAFQYYHIPSVGACHFPLASCRRLV